MNIIKAGTAAMATLAGMLVLSGAMAAETGVALKADTIRAEPFGDAKTVATLAASDKVTILGKEGGWLKVSSAKGKGWVRML
ncbi:MAG: SH3 domain-containing protein, partial [Gallionella sp.]|nr:SH3 domain-containing protein [Gallionella sp.]